MSNYNTINNKHGFAYLFEGIMFLMTFMLGLIMVTLLPKSPDDSTGKSMKYDVVAVRNDEQEQMI